MKSRGKTAGFTLVEITITLAVFGIIMAVVVAFSTMINTAARSKSDAMERIDEIDRIKTIVSEWFYNFDHDDYIIDRAGVNTTKSYDLITDTYSTYTESKTVATIKPALVVQGVLPPEYVLSFSGNELRATYSSSTNDNVVMYTKYIKKVEFEWNSQLGILKCVMSYEDDGGQMCSTAVLYYRHAS